MWMGTVEAAGQVARGHWELEAARAEAVEAKGLPGHQAVQEPQMIPDNTGRASIVLLLMPSQQPSARCVSNVDKFAIKMEGNRK